MSNHPGEPWRPGDTLFVEPDPAIIGIAKKLAARMGAEYVPHTFEDHMRPDVFWIGNPEFDAAFETMATEEIMPEVGYTKPEGSYPAYVNVKFESGMAAVTVRAAATQHPGNAEVPAHSRPGETSRIEMSIEDWDQFIADVTQARARAG